LEKEINASFRNTILPSVISKILAVPIPYKQQAKKITSTKIPNPNRGKRSLVNKRKESYAKPNHFNAFFFSAFWLDFIGLAPALPITIRS